MRKPLLRPNIRWRDEDGAATVLAAFLMLLLLVATMAGVRVGSAVVARHRAQAAADLAALAAAAALPGGREAACGRGREVSDAMAATVVRCEVVGSDVIVAVEVEALVGLARAAARAGPVAQ